MTPIHVCLTYIRSTKGLCRYEEEVREGKPALVGTMYFSKEWLGAKPPKTVTVTVTGGDDATD